jgi:hypothetical protein
MLFIANYPRKIRINATFGFSSAAFGFNPPFNEVPFSEAMHGAGTGIPLAAVRSVTTLLPSAGANR